MTANETAALAALWQPVAQIIVDQLTDYFGARLRMAEAVVYTVPGPDCAGRCRRMLWRQICDSRALRKGL